VIGALANHGNVRGKYFCRHRLRRQIGRRQRGRDASAHWQTMRSPSSEAEDDRHEAGIHEQHEGWQHINQTSPADPCVESSSRNSGRGQHDARSSNGAND